MNWASRWPKKSGTKCWPCDALRRKRRVHREEEGQPPHLSQGDGCGSTGENGEKSTIIRVAFNQPETHAEYIALADFGEKFAAATNGRYQVEIYPNAVLGDQGPVTEMIRTGAFLEPCRGKITHRHSVLSLALQKTM